MEQWIPTQKQQSGSICKTFEILNDELAKLQCELDCPDEFICDFLKVVKSRWSPDGCHSRARQHKRDNPSSY